MKLAYSWLIISVTKSRQMFGKTDAGNRYGTLRS
jgi:hypothetical protein